VFAQCFRIAKKVRIQDLAGGGVLRKTREKRGKREEKDH
jgi:hypothetical protein